MASKTITHNEWGFPVWPIDGRVSSYSFLGSGMDMFEVNIRSSDNQFILMNLDNNPIMLCRGRFDSFINPYRNNGGRWCLYLFVLEEDEKAEMLSLAGYDA